MYKLRGVVAAGMVAVSAIASAAPTMTVTWNPGVFNPTSVDVGTVTFPGGSNGTNAGRFEGTVTDWNEVDPAQFYASEDDFYAYCFDLAQTLQNGAVYTPVAGAPPTVLNWLGAVNAHFGGGPYRWLDPANRYEAAVIQLGIWESLFNDDFVLGTGLVQFSNVSPTVTNLFNAIAAERASTPDLESHYVMRLISPRRQDVITGRRVSEPASLFLVAIGAVAGAWVRRRR